MVFKINSRTRIKIRYRKLSDLNIEINYDKGIRCSLDTFICKLEEEVGLIRTSTGYDKEGYIIYFFKVVDSHKFLLGKIKYGI